MNNILESALLAHQYGDFSGAANLYRQHLNHHSQDVRALYGLGSILLLGGNLEGLNYVRQALILPPDPDFNRSLAADSVLSTLLSQQFRAHALDFLEELSSLGISIHDVESKLERLRIPSYLSPSRLDQQLGKELKRFSPMESNCYVYAIDIVGGCNLRCPTCPVANQSEMPKGIMKIELFEKILKKIRNEQGEFPIDIWLFNWTEPLLHPQIGLFIEAIRNSNYTSLVSSNLNSGDRLESLMKAQPDRLKISLSSFKQEIYGVTHARGNIAKVKANLIKLASLRDLYKSKTIIWIGHHLYRNTLDEKDEIESFAKSLGFGYQPSPATLTPIEEVMSLLDAGALCAKESSNIYSKKLADQFLFDPIDVQGKNKRMRSGEYDCELRFNMTTIQHEGNISLCCGTVQPLTEKPISFLDITKAEIENIKYNNVFCKKCIQNNLHLTISDR